MIAYILKSSLSLLILFGLYWFLLRKEKLFIFNRFFLVASVVFSLVVPFISIPVNFQISPKQKNIIPTYDYIMPEISSADNIIPRDMNINQSYVGKQPSPIDISEILLALYISGVILFLIRFLRNIYIIYRLVKLSEKINFEGYRIILTNDKTGPYCFFSSIFLNKEDYLNGKIDKELLNHELEHVRQSHTLDIILIELVKIFYWFNPIHLLYERAIRLNHEYLADNGVISDNYNIKSYSDKLLSFITGRSNMSLTSGSNHSFAKMRLLMMMKSSSGSFIYGARIAITLCLVTVFFLLLSFKESNRQPSSPNLSETRTEMTQTIIKGIVLTEDGKPLMGATIKTTLSNDTSLETITDSDGRFTINDILAGASLFIEYWGFKGQTLKADFASEMVIRLVRDPDFKGRTFIPEVQDVNFRNSDFTPAKALIVIDGVIIDYKANFKVNPGEIKSFKVLTDKEATDKYGDKGKDGVVEIVLFGNKIESAGRKPSINISSDTSKYNTLLSVNHVRNKGELIDIPIPNLQYVDVWTDLDIDKVNKKELRTINIMTRDYFKVKGRVVQEDGKPLSGVSINVSEEPVKSISDKEGRFVIEDVREDALLVFTCSGYKSYYLSMLFEVAFNMELTIKLEKD
jgi:beta-lactamase regulating signal transducer with metallopeptidase domain